MALRGLREHDIERLRRFRETWKFGIANRAIDCLLELHDDARGLRSLLQEGKAPAKLNERIAAATNSHGYVPVRKVMLLAINYLFEVEDGP
jgi:glutamine synthetase adenylyltransferase